MVNPDETLLEILEGAESLHQLLAAWKALSNRIESAQKFMFKYKNEYINGTLLNLPAVMAETPVVSELWRAIQQPWGRSLEYIEKSGRTIYDTSWGRSLEKQLRISTIGVTTYQLDAWETYLSIAKMSKG